jgi:DNA phosphorothioation-dependent restriction protein DptH
MKCTDLHALLLASSFEKILGKPDPGTVAFVRCLTPNIVHELAAEKNFNLSKWKIFCVGDADNPEERTITADEAVELREAKGEAILLLVDTDSAGAGMDGIYSAAQEVDETTLFKQALRLAGFEVAVSLSRQEREYAEQAIKTARRYRQRTSISPWTAFDFLVHVAAEKRSCGRFLHLLGLWPVKDDAGANTKDGLEMSRTFVDRLLGTAVAGLTPGQRIETLRLANPPAELIADLERFLRSASSKPVLPALAELADKPDLWVNAIPVEGPAEAIQAIDLVSWRTNAGGIVRWAGLIESSDNDPPVLIIDPEANRTGDYSRLEVRWKARPDNLTKGAVEYRVAIVTDMDEELTSREVTHGGKKEEKCRFTNDDFSMLNEDALVAAKVVVSVVGDVQVDPQETEEFTIKFGNRPEHESVGVGKKVRTFSEGLIELTEREDVTVLSLSDQPLSIDTKNFILLRTPQHGKSFRVFCPPLIREIDQRWALESGIIGRWRIKVRASGERTSPPEFIPLMDHPGAGAAWERTSNVSRRMADRFAAYSGVGQIYDEKSKVFESTAKEYLLAWAALLESGAPSLALANTVEVQSLSGRTIGLIVLPSHPLRVAWHVAYDNLVFHSAFEQRAAPKQLRDEFVILDGAMFPTFLPGLEEKAPFVFADTLGFHAVGMVPDYDKEPKAAVAVLARALGESETADVVPTIGHQSAHVLGSEISKYIDCHNSPNLLHIHALRAGDGLTVARALGQTQDRYRSVPDDEEFEEGEGKAAPAFVLELYPSPEQRAVAGRFIAEAREKRRSGAGVLPVEDRWMLESLSLAGGINLPKLRWARKDDQNPKTPAHVAVAFDTFDSRIVTHESEGQARPLFAYGLLSFFERKYTSKPSPVWLSSILNSSEGEKHPSDRTHTDRLVRLQEIIKRAVTRSFTSKAQTPILRTELSPEKDYSLRELHRLCDWVVTLDRNAGIEYFDSPRDNGEIYDAFVIDCVPEREDMGCLQLVTTTSNLDEVRNLLDGALDQMGLSHSRRNAEYLLAHLKALSGRLAIRLTGQKAPTSELIALALSHANCRNSVDNSDCWVPLKKGFLIPVDDVLDLIPPLSIRGDEESNDGISTGKARPDLIYVSTAPRKGLQFQFIEIKYRRHLRTSRNPELLEGVRNQSESLRKHWDLWYSGEKLCGPFRAVRRAKLARVLRFYAEKARRHILEIEQYEALIAEIDRMIEKGEEYTFSITERPDRGWVFCPEFTGTSPLEVSPADWNTRIFLFGPSLLPDSESYRERVPERDPHPGRVPNPASVGVNASPAEASAKAQEINEVYPAQKVDEPIAEEKIDKSVARAKVADEQAVTDSPKHQESSESLKEDLEQPEALVCLGTDLLTGSETNWPLTVKGNPHLLIAGLPGMGKTTCLISICRQMLGASVRPIVFSYHQDIDERLERIVSRVKFVDFHGLGFNPLRVIDRQSKLAYLDVAGAMRDIFVAIFPELGDIQGERIRRAIKDSFVERGWDNVSQQAAAPTEPQFKRFLEILRADPRPDRGMRALLARLDELDDYGFFDITESHDSLWDSDDPIIIRIHTTQNDNLQKAFASLIFYGLYKDMFRRGLCNRITHALIFDEAHRAARLRLIPTMAKECRKYGISLVLASQEAKDFNVSLFSAIANYLVLRLNESDAKALVRNVASSDQERALVDKIKQMDRFKALYFCEGRKKPAPLALLP